MEQKEKSSKNLIEKYAHTKTTHREEESTITRTNFCRLTWTCFFITQTHTAENDNEIS